jgi:hypothetical protein
MAPAMYCIVSAPPPVAAMMAKNGPRKANETPWMIGSRVPKRTWIQVAIPEQIITAETSRAISSGVIPIAGPSRSGTATVAPNIVSTCCSASPAAFGHGRGTSSRP